MFKIIVMVTKRADLSDEQFRRRYLDGQGPLVARFPGLRKYVQNPVIASSDPNSVAGVAELWFDDEAAWANAKASPEFAEAGRNLPSFAAHATSVVVEEIPVTPAGLD